MLVIIILLGGVSPSVSAAELTLNKAIKIAVQNNKDLQATRNVVDRANARLLQAGLPENPRLELGGSSGFLFNNAREYNTSVGFSQQFPISGRIARQEDVAQVDVYMASAEVEVAERKLARDTAATFYRLVILNKQIQERDNLIIVDKNLVRLTLNRIKAAEVSELDLSTAHIELARLQQERILLQSRQARERSILNKLLGKPAAQPLNLDDSLVRRQPLPILSELQQQALNLRPDLRVESLGMTRAHAAQELANAQSWEDWTIGMRVEQSRLSITGAPRQEAERIFGVSLSIPLPWRNKNQGRIAEAVVAGTQAQQRIEALKFSISNEVASSYDEIERLKKALQTYEHDILPAADRNARLSQQAYGLGQIPIFSVVQAQRQHSDAHVAYFNTLDQYLQILVILRYRTGNSLGKKELKP
ncbi:MAG: TolC family protein [Mariprofundaceae bacterium]|nr:TolC family protein [Mariprofundaceae bacterium]